MSAPVDDENRILVWERLTGEGVTDLTRYAVDPTVGPAPDFFV